MRFCLVTSSPICNNPRLVKEADALVAVGHEVRVVSLKQRESDAERDVEMVRRRGWELVHVNAARESVPGRCRTIWWAGVQQAVVRVPGLTARNAWLRDQGYSRYLRPLLDAACARPADVVVGHNLQALPVAARAAEYLSARLAFDFEDLYEEILPDTPENAAERARMIAIERAYAPKCDVLLAASPGIADEVSRRYRVPRPTVVLNTFPVLEAPVPRSEWRDRVDDAPALYWYSQTVGPDRGLEDAIDAMGMLGVPARLYVRGRFVEGYRSTLERHARERGIGGRLHLLGRAPADEMAARASEFDIGLALEQPNTLNHSICIPNKLLTYLAAGIAVAATDTRGQRTVLCDAPGAGFLYAPGDCAALATGLRDLVASPERLTDAKRNAREAAMGRFAWDNDAGRLVNALVPQHSAELETPVFAAVAG